MLMTRTAEAGIDDVVRSRKVERGCPQGGVLSPLLWNLLVSEVLRRLKRCLPQMLSQSQAFADDLGLIKIGLNLGTVLDLCQVGLNVSRWCREVDLGCEANKWKVIIFTTTTRTPARSGPFA
jgi:hypothetical protein